MFERFSEVWGVLGNITANFPSDVTAVVVTVFCFIGIIGVLRSI